MSLNRLKKKQIKSSSETFNDIYVRDKYNGVLLIKEFKKAVKHSIKYFELLYKDFSRFTEMICKMAAVFNEKAEFTDDTPKIHNVSINRVENKIKSVKIYFKNELITPLIIEANNEKEETEYGKRKHNSNDKTNRNIHTKNYKPYR